MRKLTTEDFIYKAKLVHGDKYDYSKTVYICDKIKVNIICHSHGVFNTRASSHLEGVDCNTCIIEKRKLGIEIFLKRAKDIYGDKYDYSLITSYTKCKAHLDVICRKHGSFKISADHHINRKQGCPKCKSLNLDGFIEKAKFVHNNKYDYSKSVYINNKANIDIICTIHGLFTQRVSDHINGKHGCPECSMELIRLSTSDFIKKSQIKHGNKYTYIKENINFKHNKEKVEIICKKHGLFKQKVNAHLSGAGCPKCSESYGERNIRLYLVKNNINFIQEHSFKDCKSIMPLFFDFYLPEFNVCLEFNGTQHYEPSKFFGGEKTYLGVVKRDAIKVEYCYKNKIELLIIKYNEDITNVLNNFLNRISIIS